MRFRRGGFGLPNIMPTPFMRIWLMKITSVLGNA